MTAIDEAWGEFMKASFGLVGTSVRVGDLMIASGNIVGARKALMGHTARCPAGADYTEIGGMLPEMVVAFSKVGQALVGQWSAMALDSSV